ncbi:hypothetical protein DVH24_005074 [Malus domestica]|uniref:Uncharacterized protein n=1 Tax=Malus domestica TaxID=3750 RepID=A0A498IDB1_MALDO|nr:hypothetical protein DVH24_005074 [Malus domestica]
MFLAMAQNSTIPVNLGVVLDFDSLFGKVGMSRIDMTKTTTFPVSSMLLMLTTSLGCSSTQGTP